MIIQNAYMIPDGRILLSESEEKEEFFDQKTGKAYYICGGKSMFFNNIDSECEPLFLNENSTLKELKNKLLWRTYGAKTWERKIQTPIPRKLIDLETDHLKVLLKNRNLSHLYKYCIGLILQERKEILRHV